MVELLLILKCGIRYCYGCLRNFHQAYGGRPEDGVKSEMEYLSCHTRHDVPLADNVVESEKTSKPSLPLDAAKREPLPGITKTEHYIYGRDVAAFADGPARMIMTETRGGKALAMILSNELMDRIYEAVVGKRALKKAHSSAERQLERLKRQEKEIKSTVQEAEYWLDIFQDRHEPDKKATAETTDNVQSVNETVTSARQQLFQIKEEVQALEKGISQRWHVQTARQEEVDLILDEVLVACGLLTIAEQDIDSLRLEVPIVLDISADQDHHAIIQNILAPGSFPRQQKSRVKKTSLYRPVMQQSTNFPKLNKNLLKLRKHSTRERLCTTHS